MAEKSMTAVLPNGRLGTIPANGDTKVPLTVYIQPTKEAYEFAPMSLNMTLKTKTKAKKPLKKFKIIGMYFI